MRRRLTRRSISDQSLRWRIFRLTVRNGASPILGTRSLSQLRLIERFLPPQGFPPYPETLRQARQKFSHRRAACRSPPLVVQLSPDRKSKARMLFTILCDDNLADRMQ